jgi:Fas apoptotic inhibitory molecule (FAIM1)
MAQAIWQFVSNTGIKHKIGLYHGDSSGHLLIYCDAKVVKVDFSIKEPTDYSFFVDDEFCRIVLHKERDSTFTYEFVIDKDANTPLNAERKVEDKRNYKWLWVMGIGIIAVVLGFFIGTRIWQQRLSVQNSGWAGVIYFPSKEVASQLHLTGTLTEAQVFYKQNGQGQIGYTFQTNQGQAINGIVAQPEGSHGLLPNGFQLYDQDTYQVRYDSLHPDKHMLDFMAPTKEQMMRFVQRAIAVESRNHATPLGNAPVCLVRCVLEEAGWEQLQHVINQFVPPSANATHNADSYLRMRRAPVFDKAWQTRCWDAK